MTVHAWLPKGMNRPLTMVSWSSLPPNMATTSSGWNCTMSARTAAFQSNASGRVSPVPSRASTVVFTIPPASSLLAKLYPNRSPIESPMTSTRSGSAAVPMRSGGSPGAVVVVAAAAELGRFVPGTGRGRAGDVASAGGAAVVDGGWRWRTSSTTCDTRSMPSAALTRSSGRSTARAAVRRAPRGAVSAPWSSDGASMRDQASSAVTMAATTWITVIVRRPAGASFGAGVTGGSASGIVTAGTGASRWRGATGAPGARGAKAGARGATAGARGGVVGAAGASGARGGGMAGRGDVGAVRGAVGGGASPMTTDAVRPVAVAVDPPAWPAGDDRSSVGVVSGAPGWVDHGPAAACPGACGLWSGVCSTGVDVISAWTGRSGSGRGGRGWPLLARLLGRGWPPSADEGRPAGTVTCSPTARPSESRGSISGRSTTRRNATRGLRTVGAGRQDISEPVVDEGGDALGPERRDGVEAGGDGAALCDRGQLGEPLLGARHDVTRDVL